MKATGAHFDPILVEDQRISNWTVQAVLAVKMLCGALLCWWTGARLLEFDNSPTVLTFLIPVLLISPFLVRLAGERSIKPSRIVVAFLIVLSAHLAIERVRTYRAHVSRPPVIDIGTTSVAAGRLILEGRNPYAAKVDFHPVFKTTQRNFWGYKYLPMMALFNLPLSHRWSTSGIVTTNLLFDAVLMVLLFLIVRRMCGSGEMGLFAVFGYLLFSVVPLKFYVEGANDLIPIALALAGFYFLERRPFLSGLFLGLSTASKLMPGLLFFVLWFTHMRSHRYVFGFLAGLLPTVPFFLWNPGAFIENAILFTFMRPYDSTWCWYLAYPPEVAIMVKAGTLAAETYLLWFLYRYRPGLVALAAVSSSACIYLFIGRAVRGNYHVWWIPFFLIVLSKAVATLQASSRTPAALEGATS